MSRPKISVIIATRNRCEVLAFTLKHLVTQIERQDQEVIVLDNGSDDGTADLLRGMCGHDKFRMIDVNIQGKSHALNVGIECASGDLLLFSDDDVSFPERWIESYEQGALQWPGAGIFCGPILPILPPGTPAWMASLSVANLAFAEFGSTIRTSGPLQAPLLPYGPNMAVRRSALGSHRFRTDLGPSAAGPFMCEDSDLMGRLRDDGQTAVFLKEAAVYHRIRPELLDIANLMNRAFNFGRSAVMMDGLLYPLNVSNSSTAQEIVELELGMHLNALYGQLAEFLVRADQRMEDILRVMIYAASPLGQSDHLLGSLARQWRADRSEYFAC